MKLLARLFCQRAPTISVRATSERVVQTFRLEPSVLYHVGKHRQLGALSTEAGGQLFGLINANEVRVVLATGPYRGDERGRYHYRSNSQVAQRTIERQAKKGFLYLGEWHTHAEDYPIASSSDMDTMRKLLTHSKLKRQCVNNADCGSP